MMITGITWAESALRSTTLGQGTISGTTPLEVALARPPASGRETHGRTSAAATLFTPRGAGSLEVGTLAPRRGHLYWVNLDKRRPALVLSPDYRNRYARDIIVVPCSVRLRPAPTHVMLRRGQGGLAENSVLKCEQITALSKADVAEPAIGKPLPTAILRAVERAVLRAIGVPVPLEPA